MLLKKHEQYLFSHNELELIKTLGKKTMTMKEIAKELYHPSCMPKFASTAVSSLIYRVNKKALKNHLDFKIYISQTNGGRTPKKIKIETK